MVSVLPSLAILGFAALAAIYLARSRSSHGTTEATRNRAARMLTVAVAIQGIHFIEEAVAGFHIEFPALFGLPPMPFTFFVAFNLLWIAIWSASIPGLRNSNTLALFAAWFLAIAGILNGFGHPLMALITNGYFPGLLTSPFIGLAAFRLWRILQETTNSRARTD